MKTRSSARGAAQLRVGTLACPRHRPHAAAVGRNAFQNSIRVYSVYYSLYILYTACPFRAPSCARIPRNIPRNASERYVRRAAFDAPTRSCSASTSSRSRAVVSGSADCSARCTHQIKSHHFTTHQKSKNKIKSHHITLSCIKSNRSIHQQKYVTNQTTSITTPHINHNTPHPRTRTHPLPVIPQRPHASKLFPLPCQRRRAIRDPPALLPRRSATMAQLCPHRVTPHHITSTPNNVKSHGFKSHQLSAYQLNSIQCVYQLARGPPKRSAAAAPHARDAIDTTGRR